MLPLVCTNWSLRVGLADSNRSGPQPMAGVPFCNGFGAIMGAVAERYLRTPELRRVLTLRATGR